VWSPFIDGPRNRGGEKRGSDPADNLFEEPGQPKAPGLFSETVFNRPARKPPAKAVGKKRGQKGAFEDDDDFLTGQAEKKKPRKELFADEDDILAMAPSLPRKDDGKQTAPVGLFADDDLLIAPVVAQRRSRAPGEEEEEFGSAMSLANRVPSTGGSPE
jgi:hypothetical protein